ncbi:fungal-specific transcription factor domain-containing protein [Ilyonectria sp. MPI-CAGE-AT-0026]|nr:fungal-specific transcription factor domain-containing protein [Ilyonectria sp. MPI-CAGE-AT-0026]
MPPTISIPPRNGMFHTFQGITPQRPSVGSPDSPKTCSSGNKRITTPHACAECKRRKIRCDGKQPCGQCLSSRAPKRCFYDKHRQRVIPSRKTLEALSQSREECRSILKRLYPNHEPSALIPLSRQELLDLLGPPTTESTIALPSPPLNSAPLKQEVPLRPETGLALLEQVPSHGSESDEERRGRDHIPVEADDVNALSLNMDRQTSSYLGASSIKAALLVMLKVQPQLRDSLSQPLTNFETMNNLPCLQQRIVRPTENCRVPWSWKGQTLIDAYFKRVHVFVPMLDEPSFRADCLGGQRCDSPWLGLLNMVFAMGSIAAMKSDDFSHIEYYHKAMEHLTIDSLGSSHIEIVQALALLGGYYLHYVNRPNMANAVLGAALRTASALGLHRQFQTPGSTDGSTVEVRRRTWWSLICLDTWATTTLGRPSLGRWGPEVNIRPPEVGIDEGHDSAQHVGILPLVENIKFCQIATQVQDILAVAPLLKIEDRKNMDGQLINWYNNLPWLLRSNDPCAEPLYLSRCVMKWRYQNLRMLLHRPILLSMASNGVNSQAGEHEIAAVETCRELAKATIDEISREWARNQMSGWNAVWFLYQAVMVPLVSIYWQWNSPFVSEWQMQIEATLTLFDAMEDWSLAARRSREVVRRLYEARHQCCYQSPLSSAGTDPSMMLGDTGLHMSPIELDLDDMVGMLDQQGIWDLDGMYWGESQDTLPVDSEMYNMGNDGMMQVGHGSISLDGSSMDSTFLVQ